MARVTAQAPWHFWLVSAIAVAWNGFGAFDYVMSLTQGDPYLRAMGMTETQIAFYHAMPVWMIGVWTLGVWGSVIGTVLLILRSRHAVIAFAASLAGAAFSLAYSTLLSDGAKVMGPEGTGMAAVIIVICAVFLWYAWAMAKRGLLR